MTFYNHFPSKDDLIVAVLQYREDAIIRFFHTAIENHGKRTHDRVDAFFAALKDWFETPGFRGCAFINAVVELADKNHPGYEYAFRQKRRFQVMLKRLIVESYGKKAAKFAPAISLLVEGAIVTAQIQGRPDAAATARAAALRLLRSIDA